MKTINETFTIEEFNKLKRAKKKSDSKTWHDFFMSCAESILKGDDKTDV